MLEEAQRDPKPARPHSEQMAFLLKIKPDVNWRALIRSQFDAAPAPAKARTFGGCAR